MDAETRQAFDQLGERLNRIETDIRDIRNDVQEVRKDVREVRVILNIDQQIENLKTVRSA